MKEELLWNGRFCLRQRAGVFPLSMDTMALADFASVGKGDTLWDLGCGSGALALLLAGREPTLYYHGLDCSEEACTLAEENLSLNGLAGRILLGKIEALPQLTPPGKAKVVVSNPPYFPPEQGKPGQTARTGCNLAELCAGAAWLLQNGGRFATIYPVQALADLICTLRAAGLEPKRMQLAAHRLGAVPKRVLIEAVKQGKPGAEVLSTLYWYEADGSPSEDYKRIYHMV